MTISIERKQFPLLYVNQHSRGIVGWGAYQMAGEASVDGNIDLRRAYILIDLERWQDALIALNDALKKDGLDERKMGEAYLLRGMAQFNLDNFEVAHSDWVDASQYANARESAQQWINHLREETRQRAGN